MAADVTLARDESNALRAQEESLRGYLDEKLGNARASRHWRTSALLVSGPRPENPKGLIMDASTTAAERIYLYLHLAAHVALRHNAPVMTIVEPAGTNVAGEAVSTVTLRTSPVPSGGGYRATLGSRRCCRRAGHARSGPRSAVARCARSSAPCCSECVTRTTAST